MVRTRPFITPVAAAFALLLVCQMLWLARTFPTIEEYRPGADEGTYFRQASLVLDRGLTAFRDLGQEFVNDPQAQISPVPVRVGHLLTAAAALRIERSFRALSMLSLVCHGLLAAVTFVFVRRLWDERAAFAAGVLTLASPLGAGLARRALMDTDYCLFTTLSMFTLMAWLDSGRRRDFLWFMLALTWATLVREATVILVPSFIAVAVLTKRRGPARIGWGHVIGIALVPFAVGVVHVALFGGIQSVIDIAIALRRGTSPDFNSYVNAYNAGPWFEYLLDSLLLSPITTVAFLVWCGWHAASPVRSTPTAAVIVLFWAGLISMAWLPQNPRYTIPLDPLVRVGAGLLIVMLADYLTWPSFRTAAAAASLLLMVVMDVNSFHQLFVRDRIYDPVAYNLLASRNAIPSSLHRPDPPMNADSYLHVSRAYSRARDFDQAIVMGRRALALDPANADAYNAIGAAYCEQARWRDAAAAFEEALRLRPDFSSARHNLAWAHTELSQRTGERQN
jgi:dolichyl-phosphate-mannose-protein mannosyltransferase/tetratricopeptide repeat protein